MIDEARCRDLVENSHELVCTHDLEGRILYANPAASRSLGIPIEELLALNLRDILAPEALPQYHEYLSAIVRDGEASGAMTVMTRKGERRLWLYRNTLYRDGAKPVVCGLARDVTEQERAIRELHKSEVLFRSIFENAPDIIGVIDPAGRIRYHSPSAERILGYDSGELNGMLLLDLIHEHDADRAREFFARQISEPTAAYTTELRLRRRDGSWRSFEVATTNVVRGFRVDSIVVNARDVTDRRLLEAQLEQANRLNSLGRLSATVAHEFNNVLMGMQPFAELLERPDLSVEMARRCGRHIAGSIQRGKSVALDLLRFTQPAAPNLKRLHLAEWWRRLAPEIEALCGNSIAIQVALPEPSPCALADAAQLAQVINNLTNNARDAMPKGGRLTITIREPRAGEVFPFGIIASPETFIQISCSDTGSGIPMAVMPHLFEPLFTTKQNGGTGLGLAVAHQVVSRHGGSIFVESEAGAGTTFHVFIPRFAGPCEAAAEEPAPERPVQARRLLIVDDEEVIVGGVSELLTSEGFEVHAVSNGADAGPAVARVKPDIVLLDIGLPDVDGVTVGRKLRGEHPDLPIIFSTGHGDERVALMDRGMRLLRKPFEMKTLLDTIADLERMPA